MSHQYCVYLLTNKNNTVLYTDITNNLYRRIYEHKNKAISGFTSRYNIDKLVYYEVYDSVEAAIQREKQIKGGSRQKKISLIRSVNSSFDDLYENL